MRLSMMLPWLGLLYLSALAGCQREPDPEKGESAVIRRAFPISGFSRINIKGPDSVIVTSGPRFSIMAEGQEWAISALDLSRAGEALEVGRKRWLGPTGAGAADRPLLLRITLPRLDGVALTGSGGLVVDRVRVPDFTALLTGAGSLVAPDIVVGRLIADVAGSGSMRIGGRAGSAHLSTQGAGRIDGEGLSVETVSLSVIGSGGVRVASDGEANISMLGSGDVAVAGDARCTVKRTGTGRVRCGA